jgi:hypothetical protein
MEKGFFPTGVHECEKAGMKMFNKGKVFFGMVKSGNAVIEPLIRQKKSQDASGTSRELLRFSPNSLPNIT